MEYERVIVPAGVTLLLLVPAVLSGSPVSMVVAVILGVLVGLGGGYWTWNPSRSSERD